MELLDRCGGFTHSYLAIESGLQTDSVSHTMDKALKYPGSPPSVESYKGVILYGQQRQPSKGPHEQLT